MWKKDISIFDTRCNTIENVGKNTLGLVCEHNQFSMNRDGQVVALIMDNNNHHLAAVSFTKDELKIREIKRVWSR